MLALTFLAACDATIDCFSNECVGGLAWTATTADDLPMTAGEYEVEVELEGDRFTVTCTVADDGTGQCGTPLRTAGERDFRVAIGWIGEHVLHTGPDTTETSHGIQVEARERVDGGTRGPTTAAITLRRDGMVLLEDAHSLEYERDATYHGNEECGFCDLREERAITWAQ